VDRCRCRSQRRGVAALALPITLGLLVALAATPATAQTLQPPFAANYVATDLGSAPGVPNYYGGLTIKFDDPDTLLLGGAANSPIGKLYAVPLVRDGSGHITGFAGTAVLHAEAQNIDGGLAYGPDNVLFLSRYPQNDMGQLKPGNSVTDKVVDLDAIGVANTLGGLGFVPPGFPGAGRFKVASYIGVGWYDVPLTPDGNGTFDAGPAVWRAALSGVEGIAYVPLGSPQFANPSVLVSEYSYGRVSAYEIDANGDPVVATRRNFITGLNGAEGATIDPVTGDFLFSTFLGSGGRVIAVRGFATSFCGDGVVDSGEQCDDGNTADGDCCSSTCALDVDGTSCDDGDGCTTNDVCSGGACGGSADALCGVDNFFCYKAKPAKAAAGEPAYPSFTPYLGVVVVDELGSGEPTDLHQLDLKKTIGVCHPADRDGSDPDAPNHAAHLNAYQAKLSKTDPAQPRFAKVTKTIHNSLGTLRLSLTAVDRFLEPSSSALGDAGAPPLGAGSLDRFKCYKAKVARAPKGQPPYPIFAPVPVSVVDSFRGPILYTLKKPTRFCAPADRDGLEPDAPTHPAHLVCYSASATKTDPAQPAFVKARISTTSLLADEVLDAKSPLEICVPSEALD
jgi:cysteine-rich repeat protein